MKLIFFSDHTYMNEQLFDKTFNELNSNVIRTTWKLLFNKTWQKIASITPDIEPE